MAYMGEQSIQGIVHAKARFEINAPFRDEECLLE